MKTCKINSVKTVLKTMLVLTLLTFFSCENKQGNSAKKDSRSTFSETNVKPPGMGIHTAAFMGDIKAIKQHIVAGTDLNQKDQYGSTPLTIVATFGKTEVAIVLIKAGADINLKNTEGSSPLHTAAFFCRTEIVEALLAKGANKNLKNNYGSTALESVSGSFNDVKVIYEQIGKQLGPLGLKLDYDHIELTRPKIAKMLK